MRSRMGEAMKMQRPDFGQRTDRSRGQRPEKGKRDGKKGKQQQKEAK